MASGKGNIREVIERQSKEITDMAGRKVKVLEEVRALEIAENHGLHLHEIFLEALGASILPYRYLRNREAISIKDQIRLAESRVAVVGAGGLGGNVIILLARLGIGHLLVIDHDIFDETNLNRQALCSTGSLGKAKSEEAVEVVRAINPSVVVIPKRVKLDLSTAREALSGCDVVVDALDNIKDRLLLDKAAKEHSIPMVHGALAGFEGQLMTIYPEDPGLKLVYGEEGVEVERSRSPEAILGVPALMPSLIATLQAMEVLKVLLGRGRTFRNVILHVDLETGRSHEFALARGEEQS